jgi:soluble lytic murein transglycosylase-like protein
LIVRVALCGLLLLASTAHATDAEEPVDPALRQLLIDAVADADSFQDRFDAEVWLVDMSRRLQRKVPDPEERLEILRTAHGEAIRAHLDPELVLAVIDVESNFDRFAVSYAGARGLMQVMPFWLKEIGRPQDNLFHVSINLRMGCTILRYYLDMEHGDLRRALERYNGSRGQRAYPDRIYQRLSRNWYKL